jgi:hypothetical protein
MVTLYGANYFQASPIVPMLGNAAPPFGTSPIHAYYGDVVLADENVQAVIQFPPGSATNAWATLTAFRLAGVSLLGIDTKSTTQ